MKKDGNDESNGNNQNEGNDNEMGKNEMNLIENNQNDVLSEVQNMQLLNLLQKGQIENITAEQLQLLQQYALDDGVDLNSLGQIIAQEQQPQQQSIQINNSIIDQEQLLQKLNNIDMQKPENQDFIQNLQSQMQMLQNQIHEGAIPGNNEQIDDDQLMALLNNQNISQEQLEELCEKGIDWQTLQLAGLNVEGNNNESMSEQELLAKLQQMQSNHLMQQQLSEDDIQYLQTLNQINQSQQYNDNELPINTNQKSEKEINQYLQSLYYNPLQEQAYKLDALMTNSNQIQGDNQQFVNMQNPEYDLNRQEQMNQFAAVMPRTEENISEQDFNLDEKLNEEEKLRDLHFEQQLRVFYKNMIERIPSSALDKLSKKSKAFCEQINKAQTDFLEHKKQQNNQANNEDQYKSETISEIEANEENDANSSFREVLYGQNSSLDPDQFIIDVLNQLNSFPDLKNQFKRFLPEDEKRLQEMEHSISKLKQGMNFDDLPMGTELDRSYDENSNIQKMKQNSYQMMFKLLGEHGEMKEKIRQTTNQAQHKQLQEQLAEISIQIMKVAEYYLKYVTDDIKNQFNQTKNKKQEQPNYLQQIEHQMSLLLSVIPGEIIDSYNVVNSITNPLKLIKDRKVSKQINKKSKQIKKSGKSRAQISDDDYQDSENSQNKNSQQEGQNDENNEFSSMEEEEEEEFEEEIEEEQEQEEINDEEQMIQNYKQKDEEQNYTFKIKSLSYELNNYYSNKVKDLNKQEIKTFENLQKQMRTDQDWIAFTKLFSLYLEGIISLNDMFTLFEHQFGHKIKEELQKDLESLLPTRDHSRRLRSDILKPWNDLENQKFEKINDSSYFKIDSYFPLPICSLKCNPRNKGFYQQFLNEKYLSLSTGSENFKFKVRNVNEDMIFKNEDEMYKLDTQIEMFEKCFKIIQTEISNFDSISDSKAQKQYEFPIQKLKPHMYFWEKRYKDLIPVLHHKPFKRDFLIILKTGLYGKLQELQNFKLDQQSTFDDIYRKNFYKSLDHRSFKYKEFVNKYKQKQTHVQLIRQIAQSNLNDVKKSHYQMLGGSQDSPFYHSFGNFLKQSFQLFDSKIPDDFPINMQYQDIEKLEQNNKAKFPHLRLILRDQKAIKIAIKIILLNIKFSNNYHNNDRPRLIENLKFLMQEFIDIKQFEQLVSQCGFGKVENLTHQQVEMILSKDQFFYYKLRYRLFNGEEALENKFQDNSNQIQSDFNQQKQFDLTKIKPIKIQISSFEDDKSIDSPTKIEPNLEFSQQESSAIQEKQASSVHKQEQSFEQNSEKVSSEKSKTDLKDQFKKLNTNVDDKLKKEIKQNQNFIPHFRGSKDYRLLYGPQNIFIFFKFFYAIYERIVLGEQFVKQKVLEDFHELSNQEQQKYGFCDEKGNPKQDLINLYSSERFEYLLKALFAITNSGSQALSIISNGNQSMQQQSNVIDSNKFEDFARVLLGKNAFLLFQTEKISNQALKQLQLMYSDSQCQKAFKLFKKFREYEDIENQSEEYYMNCYCDEIVEQFFLAENMRNSKGIKKNYNTNTLEEQTINHDGKQVSDKENTRQTRSETVNASFLNNQSISSINQSNFQVFRMMFSPISRTMSIHFFNLNPYQFSIQNYQQTMKDNFSFIQKAAIKPVQPNFDKSKSEDEYQEKIDARSQPPVFMKRNLKLMEKHRSRKEVAKNMMKNQNHLCLDVIPQINQISYQGSFNGEDVYVFKRKTKLLNNGKSMIVKDFQKQVEFKNVLIKKAKTIQK